MFDGVAEGVYHRIAGGCARLTVLGINIRAGIIVLNIDKNGKRELAVVVFECFYYELGFFKSFVFCQRVTEKICTDEHSGGFCVIVVRHKLFIGIHGTTSGISSAAYTDDYTLHARRFQHGPVDFVGDLELRNINYCPVNFKFIRNNRLRVGLFGYFRTVINADPRSTAVEGDFAPVPAGVVFCGFRNIYLRSARNRTNGSIIRVRIRADIQVIVDIGANLIIICIRRRCKRSQNAREENNSREQTEQFFEVFSHFFHSP